MTHEETMISLKPVSVYVKKHKKTRSSCVPVEQINLVGLQ